MTYPRPLRAIICDADAWTRRPLAVAATDAGFEVLGEATAFADAGRDALRFDATLLVVTDASLGLDGVAALASLRTGDEPPEVVIVGDVHLREPAKAQGAFGVVERGDAEALALVLQEVRDLLVTGERRAAASGGDRRSGQDRRERQEWSKVTTERRSGEERRKGPRRAADRDGAAPEVHATATAVDEDVVAAAAGGDVAGTTTKEDDMPSVRELVASAAAAAAVSASTERRATDAAAAPGQATEDHRRDGGSAAATAGNGPGHHDPELHDAGDDSAAPLETRLPRRTRSAG
jgi:hypothetical protein